VLVAAGAVVLVACAAVVEVAAGAVVGAVVEVATGAEVAAGAEVGATVAGVPQAASMEAMKIKVITLIRNLLPVNIVFFSLNQHF
jgi:hypothetical protein